MAEPDDYEEDIFADVYDQEEPLMRAPEPVQPSVQAPIPIPTTELDVASPPPPAASNGAMVTDGDGDGRLDYSTPDGGQQQEYARHAVEEDNYGPIGIKEDGKMFIGGLNWETTEQSLKSYFSQFGEVTECTVMRDSATGRSRGFGFLTFKDPKCVNTVMVKEHYLDGKIIDPKRAIPREEQERTAKIFVGGVSQEATEEEFKRFFMQFGRVIDATLMMDKDTGRPRGFGFVTFDGEAAVDATLAQPLEIHGKLIEVKRAQPRGNMRDDDEKGGKFGRTGRDNRFGRGNEKEAGGENSQQNQVGQASATNAANGGMTPATMAAYWQKMQQYFQMMQQQMAMNMATGQGNPMMGQMNPAMMQQMMMSQSRGPGNPGSMGPNGPMNPAMMQQMQQQMMQQQQQQQQQPNGGQSYSPSPGPGMMNAPTGPANNANRPGFNAAEQLAFEQRKFEEQQARRMQQAQFQQGAQFGQASTWDGMYDDVPQPTPIPTGPQRQSGGNYRGGGRGGGGGQHQKQQQPQQQPQQQQQQQSPNNPSAPVNAPTGPRNAGKPGANYRPGFQHRGGGGGGGGGRYHPYARG